MCRLFVYTAQLIGSFLTFPDAKAACESKNMTLASITTPEVSRALWSDDIAHVNVLLEADRFCISMSR
jgi:hypothetical protein